MIGCNELYLNQATMMEAMQEWIDKRMGNFAPKVTNVSFVRSGHDETFIVKTQKPDSLPVGKSDGR